MVNWSNYKTLFILFLPLLLAWKPSTLERKWGFLGHQQINRLATFTLPFEMFGFYKDHIEFITEHAVDPDKRRYAIEGEAQCHYIDLDHYYKNGENPFKIIPKYWTKAVEKYSEDTLSAYGILPWHIQIMKQKLQKAYETKNVDLILKYSSDIGHYVADAHVPLHTTQNYNGQLTNQIGIHGLWESRLVELHYSNYSFFVGKAKYMENLLSETWNIIETSHSALDSVLSIEKKLSKTFPSDKKYSFEQTGNQITRKYSPEFCHQYHLELNNMVERRMQQAVLAVGSIWYTAWVDAGQPNLNELRNQSLSQTFLHEIKNLDSLFQKHQHKGRVCD